MPRLLVLDDDHNVGRLISRLGSMRDYDVVVTPSYPAFLGALDGGPDLIFIDLVMPEMDGVEVMRWLASREGTPPIVIMSGLETRTLATAESLARARGLEVLGCLEKPFRVTDFFALIDRVVSPAIRSEKRETSPVTVAALERAIDRQELTVHFQPQVRFDSGELVGFEALARWPHPERGFIAPDIFIKLAERHGLIESLTELVLDQSFDQLHRWKREGLETRVAVNISAHSLRSLAMPERIVELAARRQVDLSRIVLEITESGVSEDPLTAIDVLLRLRMRGVELSIDDFGTGYSTMEQLASIPFVELKIDRLFVSRSRTDSQALAIVESSVELGHKLGLRVVAEGVEVTEDWRGLRELGCDSAQGFFVARPMAGELVPEWAAAWSTGDHGLASA